MLKKLFAEYGSELLTSVGLGAAHVYLPEGLDIKGKIPLDGALALAGIIGGAWARSSMAREVGKDALGVWTFRMTQRYATKRLASDTTKAPQDRVAGWQRQDQLLAVQAQQSTLRSGTATKVAGEFGQSDMRSVENDPITQWARRL